MMAPTERSMPAVRMMIVWPMPSVPTIMTCWMITDRLSGLRKRGDASVKKTAMTSSTVAGPRVGWSWSRSRMRCSGLGGPPSSKSEGSAMRGVPAVVALP